MTWRRALIAVAVIIVLIGAFGAVQFVREKNAFDHIEIAAPGHDGVRVHQAGVFANYFPSDRSGRQPGIVLLGGSEGGISRYTNDAARALQDEGFSVLAPSYFGGPDEPKHLVLVPLETFDRAIDWLRRQPAVDPQRIAIAGVSKGAEAALLVATRHPELRAVFAGVPSSVVWPGIQFGKLKTPSSWTLGGKPLPFLPYGPFRFSEVLGDVGAVYRDGLKHASIHADVQIPIEKIKAPVLLECGEADKLWPSCVMARQLKARAEQHGGPSVQLLAYPDAGHLSVGPPVARSDPLYRGLARFGGTIEGNNRARVEGWPKIVAFARRALGSL